MVACKGKSLPNTAPLRGIYDVHPNPARAPGLAWWESARFQGVCVA